MEENTQVEGVAPAVADRLVPSDAFFIGAFLLLFGIFAASAGWSFFASAGGAFGIITLLALLLASRIRFRYLALFAFFFLGFFYLHFFNQLEARNLRVPFGVPLAAEGVVIREPKTTEKSQELLVKLSLPFHGKVRVSTVRATEFRYGDVLALRGAVEPPDKEALIFAARMRFPAIARIGSHAGFWFKEKLLVLKGKFVDVFRQTLNQDRAALLSGLTFGAQSDFSRERKSSMALSGTTHLVALSGYNISILALAIAAIFRRFASRRLMFVLTSIAIAFFVLMVGGEASVVRAAIMGILVLFARELGRSYSARNAVVFAAALMAFVNPRVLYFDLGFQLSFLALLGIVYLEPALAKAGMAVARFRLRTRGDRVAAGSGFLGWREHFRTTLAAQLAVVPLLVTRFDSFSLTSIAANVLILEFVPLTMALGFLLAAVGALLMPLGMLLGQLVVLLLAYELTVIDFFAAVRIPFGALLHSYIAAGAYYALIIALAAFAMRKRTA